jgi:hypothetical protein
VSGGVSTGFAVSVPNPLGGLQQQFSEWRNPSRTFQRPPGTVKPGEPAVPQNYGAQYQGQGPSGVGLVWPPAGGLASNNPDPSAVLNVGVPGFGGYQLLPPGYDAAAIRKAAQVCPGIKRIVDIQSLSGTSGPIV